MREWERRWFDEDGGFVSVDSLTLLFHLHLLHEHSSRFRSREIKCLS
jgi:hypothetical protein